MGVGLIEPGDKNVLGRGLMVARLLVQTGQHVPVRVFNPGKDPMLLYKGTVAGQIIPISEESIQIDIQKKEHLRTMTEDRSDQDRPIPTHLQQLIERSCAHLNEQQGKQVRELILEYQDVFSRDDMDIGKTDLVKHSISTGDSRPIRQPYRRLPIWQQQEAETQIKDMLERGVIEKSNSPWASPIVLVKKKDGTTRFCIDYQRLNEVTIKDAYPLPRIDDTLDALSGAEWFSTLDLASGYWQVELDEDAKEKSAFTVRGGLYQWRVMPFGLCNAPSTFERLMERILTGLHWEILLVYLDDIIIYGKTFEDELARLRVVFKKMREAKLKLKPKKCHLFKKKVAYLGHVVSAEGVSTDPDKIEAVKRWPAPKTVTEVRSFLGLASYYRRFIQGFAEIAKPLHRLTEKNNTWHWTKECQEAFRELKTRLINAPILAYPSSEGRFILDTDASGQGIGAVLSQVQDGVEKVVSYASRSLNKSERNYCVTRRELLAVVYFIKKHRHYLYGRDFEVRTDHAALKWLLSFKDPEGQLARWLDALSEYHFTITHRAGRSHGNADGMSRIPCIQCGRMEEEPNPQEKPRRWVKKEAAAINPESVKEIERLGGDRISPAPGTLFTKAELRTMILVPSWSSCRLREHQMNDKSISVIVTALEQSPDRPPWSLVSQWSPAAKAYWSQWRQMHLKNGVLYRKWEGLGSSRTRWQLLVPVSLKDEVLEQAHSTVTAGHFGVAKTLQRLRRTYYWSGHSADVRSWCRKCGTCCARRPPLKKHRAALQQYIVAGPMERIAMDILGPLPETDRGNQVILVVADYFTKWVEAFALPNQEATTIATKLVEEVICRFGVPRELHSDQGSNFQSKMMAEVCRLLGIQKTRTTPYNPKSDGLVERFNRTLLDTMAKLLTPQKSHRNWDQVLPFALMAYRSAVQESTGETPNMLMLGREVNTPTEMLVDRPPDWPDLNTDYARWLRDQLQVAWERARVLYKESAIRQKKYYDQRAQGGRFIRGGLVWLHQVRLKKGACPKLQNPWCGPWMVMDKLSDVTYRIQQGPSGKPKVVHFDRLKDFLGDIP